MRNFRGYSHYKQINFSQPNITSRKVTVGSKLFKSLDKYFEKMPKNYLLKNEFFLKFKKIMPKFLLRNCGGI